MNNNLALLYRRTSTNKQDNSIEVQESHSDEYCKRMGLSVVCESSDPDVSGGTPFMKRAGGQQLITTMKTLLAANPSDKLHVIVTKQDRLGRDTVDQIATIRRFWEVGVMPHIVMEGGPLPKTPQNELLMEIKASTNQYERNQIRERIKTALDHRRARGMATGKPPYGWDHVPTGEVSVKTERELKRVVPNDYELSWLKQMVLWRNAGWSNWKIAAELNKLGVPTKIPVGTTILTRLNGKRVSHPCQGGWKPITVWKVISSAQTLRWLVEQQIPIGWPLGKKAQNWLNAILAERKAA